CSADPDRVQDPALDIPVFKATVDIDDLLTHSGDATFTLAAQAADTETLTVTGNFALGASSTFTVGTNNPDILVAGDWEITAGGTFNAGSGEVTLNGSGAQAITSTTESFNDLVINKGGNIATLQDAAAVAGNLTVQLGTLAVSTYNLAVTGNSVVTGSGGTATVTIGISGDTGWTTTDMTVGASGVITCSGTSKITASGSWDHSAGAFTCSTSIVTLTGTGNLSAAWPGHHFYDLSMAADTKTTTLGNWRLYVDHVLTLGTGIVNGGTVTLYLSWEGGTPFVNGGATITLEEFVYGSGGGTTNVAGGNYGTTTLTLSHATGSNTWDIAGVITVNGTFNIDHAGSGLTDTVNTNNYALNVTGITTTGGGAGALNINCGSSAIDIGTGGLSLAANFSLNLQTSSVNVAGPWTINSSATVDPGTTSTVTLDGDTAQNITSNGQSFNDLVIDKGSSSSASLQDAAAVAGNLTVQLGTLAVSTYNLAVTGNSEVTGSGGAATVTIGISGDTGWTTTDMTIGASGVVTCVGASKINIGGSSDISAGTFTKDTSTVTFTATSAGKTVKSGSNTYYNVIWNGANDWTLQDNFIQTNTTGFTLGTLNLDGKTYQDTTTGQTITFGSGFTLNIGTGWLRGRSTTNLNIGTGAQLTISTGAISGGSITVDGTGTFTCTDAAQITVYGDLAISSANFDAGTSLFTQYDYGWGDLTTTQLLYDYTFGTTSPAAQYIRLLADLTVENDFTITSNPSYTYTFDANNHTIYVGGDFTISSNGVFQAEDSTVQFNGDSTQNITSDGESFNHLVINKAGGAATLLDAAAVGGNLTVQKGELAVSTYNLAVTGNSVVTGSGGTATVTIGASADTGWTTTDMTIGADGVVTCSGASKITASGNWDSSAGTFNYDQSTVTLTGTGNLKPKFIDSLTPNFYNLTMAAADKTTTMQNHVGPANLCTLGSGILSGGGYNLRLYGNGTPLVNGGATITLSYFLYRPTSGTTNITAGNYGATTLSLYSLDDDLTFNLAGDITVNGKLDLSITGGTIILNTQNYQITATGISFGDVGYPGPTTLNCGSSIIDIGTSGIIVNNSGSHNVDLDTATITCEGPWTMVDGTGTITIDDGESSVTFDGTVSRNLTSNSQSFHDLVINKGSSAAIVLQDAAAVTNNLTVQLGELTVSTYNLAVTGNSTVTGSGGTATVTIGASADTGWTTTDMTIGADGVVTCSGASKITASGNWDNGGTFNAGSSTVTLDGTDQSILGSNTFNDLTKIGSGQTLTFEAGSTQTITGTTTLQGNSTLSLRSSSDGVEWNIDPQGDVEISSVDVQDSYNVDFDNSGNYIDPLLSVDSGNNYGWFTPSDYPDPPPDPDPEDPEDPEWEPEEEESLFLTPKGTFGYEEGEKYKKYYPRGKYRTIVIVYEGRLVVGPYDEKGLQEYKALPLTGGQQASQEGIVQ
ncbi:beta strand repeat-containing protein, partial [Candidatus Omnitrophota bacterium]